MSTFQQRMVTRKSGDRRYMMLLKEIMTPDVEVIHPEATLQEAARYPSAPASDWRAC
jgi:hypothetical protein